MSKKNRTKQMFADKIQEIAKRKNIREIQIKDLCEACGVERTTFYYHFRDKYDLVAWIFAQYYSEEAGMAESPNDEKMICQMFCRMEKQRAFFLNALQDHSQNNLTQYILDFYIKYERDSICRFLQTDILNEEIEYTIRQYSFGCMGHTIEWLKGKNSLTPEKLAYYQYKFMPEILKKAAKAAEQQVAAV